jgi:phage repressor protein C with HTH and peptisase S24 domain
MKFPISHFVIHGNSMFPTLKPGQHVFTVNWFFQIKVGDLVVARVDGKDIIKRVGQLKAGKVFLVGDNKAASTDSREFGWIDVIQVVRKVFFIVP